MTIQAVVEGRTVRLLASWNAPGVVLDRWEDPAEPLGSLRRVGVAATILSPPSGEPNSYIPWADLLANSHVSEAHADPVERYREAVRQGRARARDRLSGPLEFRQVWPPV